MGDLGNLLREAREKKSLSLEQVEADTRIRYKFLVALENEDYGALPAPAYVKGFLKTYAAYLGLDPQQVLALYHAVAATPSDAKLPSVPLVEVPMEGRRSLWPVIMGLAIVAGVLLLAAAVVRTPWRSWLGLAPTAPQATATPTATVTPTPLPQPTPTFTPAPSPTAAVEPTSTPAPTAGVRVQFVVTGRSWVQIVADDAVVYAGLLENETREWEAARKIVARIGNAGAVDVTVNGQHVGVLGQAGEVIVSEWLAEGAQPTPTATP